MALPRGAMDWSAVGNCAITDYTHLLLKAMTKKIIDSIAQFGMYCICLTNVHISNRYEALKQLIARAISKKLFKRYGTKI